MGSSRIIEGVPFELVGQNTTREGDCREIWAARHDSATRLVFCRGVWELGLFRHPDPKVVMAYWSAPVTIMGLTYYRSHHDVWARGLSYISRVLDILPVLYELPGNWQVEIHGQDVYFATAEEALQAWSRQLLSDIGWVLAQSPQLVTQGGSELLTGLLSGMAHQKALLPRNKY